MPTIAIVDYGTGNFHSVARALKAAAPDADIRICNTAGVIDAADRVVFPGQGAMRDCMRTLDRSGLRDAVVRAARNKPLLGVCVGEQMLFSRSEEGDTPCLDVFPGTVARFSGAQFADRLDAASCDATPGALLSADDAPADPGVPDGALTTSAPSPADSLLAPALADVFSHADERLKIPHMGWNRVHQTQAHALWSGVPDGAHFYFVHSYYAVPAEASLIVGESDYGGRFTCAVARDNVFAVQFHPEKSADHGLRLYRNFVDWQPN